MGKQRSRLVRVAVVQIECHPAAYISFAMPLEEPFLDKKRHLAGLGHVGYQVSSLQETCLASYLEWHRNRLRQIVTFLMSLDPPPDLIILPEYSVPWQCLLDLHAVLAAPSTSLFAGTHTISTHPEALKVYRALGIEQARVFKCAKSAATAVLPILATDRVRLLSKTSRSPYEKTEVTPTSDVVPAIEPIRFGRGQNAIRVLPLLCSEALQLYNVMKHYNLTVVLSAEEKPSRFDSILTREVSNRHPTVYCNDAAFGGSGIFSIGDDRIADWQRSTVQSLPAGEEGFIVTDLNLDATAVDVGTAAPSKQSRLVLLGSIVYSDMAQSAECSQAIVQARGLEDAIARSNVLADLIASGKPLQLQIKRIEHLCELAKRGTDSEDVWNAIGNDLVLPQQSLRNLEAAMADLCRTDLQANLSVGGTGEGAAVKLVEFLAKCQEVIKAIGRSPNPVTAVPPRPAAGIINRTDEAAAVVSFLDHRRQILCQILGREQIGKSIVLEKALAQAGTTGTNTLVIRMKEESSAEYLLASIVFAQSFGLEGQSGGIAALIEQLPSGLRRHRLIVIEDAHTMLRGGAFRSAELEEAFRRLINGVSECSGKLIVLGRRSLPEDILEPSRCQRVWIQGLEGGRAGDGVLYLDTQLRRVGISPRDVDDECKREIVNTLGGHPIALALAADSMFQDGIHETLRQIRGRDGFWKGYVERTVKTLELDDEDCIVLRVLSGCRTPVARDLVQQCVEVPFQPIVRKLIALCLIDVFPDDRLWLSRLLAVHWRFQDLPQVLRERLHRNAASWYERRAHRSRELESMVEAEYHAKLGGTNVSTPSGLTDGHIGSARALFSQQRFVEAKIIIDQVLTVTRTRDVVRWSALIDCRCRAFDSAIAKVREVLNEDPSDAWLLQQIAKAALDFNRIDVLEQLIGIARAASMDDYRISLVEGRMCLRQRQLIQAIHAFETARDLTQYDAWPYFYLGRAHMQLGDMDEAIKELEDGVEFYENKHCHNPRLVHAMRGLLAQCYIFHGDDDAAERLISLVQAQGESSPEITRALAMLSLKKEGIQQANEAYRRLRLADMPRRDDRCQFHVYYGMFLRNVGDLRGACEQFTHAHTAVSTNVYPLNLLASTLFDLADRATHEGTWAREEGPAVAYARRCAAIVRQILDLSPANTGALRLQEELYHRFRIQA